MDHADAKRNCIMRSCNLPHLAVYENLTAVSGVKSIGNAHGGGLARPVFSHDRVNSTRRDLKVHPIVSEDISKPLGYISEFEHVVMSLVLSSLFFVVCSVQTAWPQ